MQNVNQLNDVKSSEDSGSHHLCLWRIVIAMISDTFCLRPLAVCRRGHSSRPDHSSSLTSHAKRRLFDFSLINMSCLCDCLFTVHLVKKPILSRQVFFSRPCLALLMVGRLSYLSLFFGVTDEII